MKCKIIVLLALSWCVTSKNNDDDEGRSYEFGFTIDGQQHRHESKDVNGIINGEFGFITADGIYHVTVYATDENGSFKILSMRNVRVSGPLDQPGYEFPSKTPTGQTHEKLIASPGPSSAPIIQQTTLAPTTNFKAPYIFTTLPSLNVAACSSCRLPSTTPRPAGVPKNKLPFQTPSFQNNNKQEKEAKKKQPNQVLFDELSDLNSGNNQNNGNRFGDPLPENYEPFIPSVEQQPPLINSAKSPNNYQPNKDIISNIPNSFGNQSPSNEKLQSPPGFQNNPLQSPPSFQNNPLQSPPSFQNNPLQTPSKDFNQNPTHENLQSPVNFQNNPTKQTYPSYTPSTPITVSNQQINIPGKTPIPIKDPYPNMVDGLPNGITENDMLDLLYKFNYTVGFHGHHEKGLKNGAKIGAYFVNGRDGISRVVEYIADENGYRPKVKFINLGLDSPDTPKEGNEKSFGLKGFEFVWYPV